VVDGNGVAVGMSPDVTETAHSPDGNPGVSHKAHLVDVNPGDPDSRDAFCGVAG
jgi:hypothetical protein